MKKIFKTLIRSAALLVLSALGASGAHAQSSFRYDNVVFKPSGGFVSFAKITVCNGAAFPIVPCTSGNASLFSDPALSLPLGNPVTSDVNGNYGFYVSNSQNYTITVTAAGFTGYSVAITPIASGGASNLSQLSGGTAPSGQTYNFGNATSFTAPQGGNAALKCASTDGCQFVSPSGNDSNDGRSMGSAKGNSDLGVAVAAAESAIGANPGTIYILPGSYNQATSIPCVSDITISGYGAVVTSTVAGSSLVCANVVRSRVFGMRFIGPSTTGSAIGFQLGVNSGGSGVPTEWNSFRDLWFTNFHYGVDGEGSTSNGTYYNTLVNVSSQANGIGFHIVPGTANFFNDNSFLSVFSASNTTDAYVIDGANGNQFSNAEGEVNGGCGVHFTGAALTQGNTFSGGWMESNTTADICTGSVSNVEFNVFSGTTLESSTNYSTLANLLAGHNTIAPGNANTTASDLSLNAMQASIFQSNSASPAQSGILRLAHSDFIGQSNLAGSGDDTLGICSTSDNFCINGFPIIGTAARSSGLAPIRFPNGVSSLCSGWGVTQTSGTSTLTCSGITDPFGNTNAGQASSTASASESLFFTTGTNGQQSVNLFVGEFIVGGVWTRSVTKNGYINGDTAPSISIIGTGFTASGSCNGNSNSGDGDWVWSRCLYEVTAIGTNPALVSFQVNFNSTFEVQVFAPVLNFIAAGTISNDEALAYENSLIPYDHNCTVGSLCGMAAFNPIQSNAYLFGGNSFSFPSGGSGGTICVSGYSTAGCGGGGTPLWNAITNPSGNQALSMGSNTSTWSWGTNGNQIVWSTGSISFTAQLLATSSANSQSPLVNWNAQFWNGAASANDNWQTQVTYGAGANPATTFNIFHNTGGTTGTATVEVPNLTDSGVTTNDVLYGGGPIAGVPSPAGPGVFTVGYAPTTSSPVAPTTLQAGLNSRTLSSSDTIAYSDVGEEEDMPASGPSANFALTLPTPTTLNNSVFYTRVCNFNTNFNEVVTPTTFTINGASTLTISGNQCYLIMVDPAGSNWHATVAKTTPTSTGVTSVAQTMPGQFAVGGSPITSTGTLADTWVNPITSPTVDMNSPFVPLANARRFTNVVATGGGAFTPMGDAATITPSGSGVAPTATASAGTEESTGGTSGTPAGMSGNLIHRSDRAHGMIYIEASTISALSNARMFVGVTDQTIGTMGGSDVPAGNYIGVMYSSTGTYTGLTDTTHFVCVSKDGTTQNPASSGVSADTNPHVFGIVETTPGTTWTVYIDGSSVCTVSANLPTNGTNLRHVEVLENLTAANINATQYWMQILEDK